MSQPPIDEKRLAQLRMAAEVGMRMAALQPHTVQVRPDELAALVEEVHVLRGQQLIDRRELARLDGELAKFREAKRELEASSRG